jgi:hypothetical protein
MTMDIKIKIKMSSSTLIDKGKKIEALLGQCVVRAGVNTG